MSILKQKLIVLRKTKCSHKNNKKELRNSVCYIATIFQLVPELEKNVLYYSAYFSWEKYDHTSSTNSFTPTVVGNKSNITHREKNVDKYYKDLDKCAKDADFDINSRDIVNNKNDDINHDKISKINATNTDDSNNTTNNNAINNDDSNNHREISKISMVKYLLTLTKIGNNDLKSEKTPVQICYDIVNLTAAIRDKG